MGGTQKLLNAHPCPPRVLCEVSNTLENLAKMLSAAGDTVGTEDADADELLGSSEDIPGATRAHLLPRQQFHEVVSAEDGRVIDYAPLAPRPAWLPAEGARRSGVYVGQRATQPIHWSVSLGEIADFLDACIQTSAWRVLAAAKGEAAITMYDIAEHFILPWTRGTGCSIALLLASALPSDVPPAADAVLAHAWGASTLETRGCIRELTRTHGLSPNTRVFFDALCLYLPDDGAAGGLMIVEQSEASTDVLDALATKMQYEAATQEQVDGHDAEAERAAAQAATTSAAPEDLASCTPIGLVVIQTVGLRSLSRAWIVHELSVAMRIGLPIKTVFVAGGWSLERLEQNAAIFQRDSTTIDCTRWQDKAMIFQREAILTSQGRAKAQKVVRAFHLLSRKELRQRL
jgi:hypothetical protein